jgi:catechol 2,3-dioxygenase-like lactoylglutathione lyase family enzyme
MAVMRYIVGDVQSSVAFYTEALGFEFVRQPGPPIAIVRRGDLELWLAGPTASASRPMPDGRKPEPGGWNRLVVQVENLDEKVRSLKDRGCRFRNDILDGPGGRQILLEDPSGNPVELFQPR